MSDNREFLLAPNVTDAQRANTRLMGVDAEDPSNPILVGEPLNELKSTVVTDGETVEGDGSTGNPIKVKPDGIGNDQLDDDAVTGTKVRNGTLGEAKLDTATRNKIAQGVAGDTRSKENQGEIGTINTERRNLERRVDGIDTRVKELEFPARLTVTPESVANMAGIQRTYTYALVDENLDLLNAEPFRTRPLTRIRLREVNTGTVVHEEAWSLVGDDWVSQFSISAGEASNIGLTGSDEFFDVFAEFGHGSGTSFEIGVTDGNPLSTANARVLVGNRPEFPATREFSQAGDTFNSFNAGSSTGLSSVFTSHLANDDAAIIHITSDFTASSIDFKSGERYYLAPQHGVAALMVKVSDPPASGGGGGTTDSIARTAAANAKTAADNAQSAVDSLNERISPFADIEIAPAGLVGNDFPSSVYILLDERVTTRTINGLTLNLGGFTKSPHSTTPVSSFATATRALVRFDLSASDRDTLKANNASTSTTTADLTFSFTVGSDHRHNLVFPVNNPAYASVDARVPGLVTQVKEAEDDIDALEARNPTAVSSLTFSSTLAVDWNDGLLRDVTLTADTTINFSNVGAGEVLTLETIQDTTGGRGITWHASVRWAGGVAPTPTATANARDVYTFLALASNRIVGVAVLDVS